MTLAAIDEALDPTTARLVVAAAEVFAEQGYEGAGVAEIARRAGLTTGAIYSRFAGKAELLAEAIKPCTQRRVRRAVRRARASRAGHRHPRDRRLPPRHPGAPTRPGAAARGVRRRPPRSRGGAAAARAPRRPRAERLAALVETAKAAGIIDPELDTGVDRALRPRRRPRLPAVRSRRAENPDARSWETVDSPRRRSVVPHADDDIVASSTHRNEREHTCPPTSRSSAEPTSTTSKRSSRSPTPTSTRPSTRSKDNADAIFTWDYEKGAAPGAQQAVREGQDVAVERRDRPRLVDRRRSREGRRRASKGSNAAGPFECAEHSSELAVRELGRQGVDRARHRVA